MVTKMKGKAGKTKRRMFRGMKLNVKFTIIILVFVFVPSVFFTILFFHNMEETIIDDGYRDLEYSLEKSHDEIAQNVDNINMSTQFFLSDRYLTEYLERIDRGEEISYEEMMNFYNVNIAALERMVNSNPYLYQIRVYVDGEDFGEMMPILYSYERLNRLPWAKDKELEGWKFGYFDTIFDSYTLQRDEELLARVTPVKTYDDRQIGVLEVAVGMKTMFPDIYRQDENRISFFVDGDGEVYSNEENKEKVSAYLQANPLPKDQTGSVRMERHRWQGQSVLVGSRYVRELGGTFVTISNLQESINELYRNRNGFLLVLLLALVMMSFLVNFVVNRLLSKFYGILQSIRKVQGGNLDVVITDCGNDEMGELGRQINEMLERIRALMKENINRELLAKNSEIRALQNQINAHFIYNVLESVKMMAEIDEKYDIADAITSLGKLLRYSMRWTSGNVTVGEELEYIKNYLALINLRFDYEIYLSLNIPEIILHQEIPKMSLQPIVENAICHGLEQLAEDTYIYVKGRLEGGDCIIEITDPGKGMSREQVEELYRRINGELESGGGGGNGIGLKNVQDRIRICFGEGYGIHVCSRLGCYTKVQVKIPQTYYEQQKAEA